MLMQNKVLICALRVLINMLVICMLISNSLILRTGPKLCYEIYMYSLIMEFRD